MFITEVQLVEQNIPKQVFGGIAEKVALGAKARFTQKQQTWYYIIYIQYYLEIESVM